MGQTNTTEQIKLPGMGAIVHPNGVHFRVWAPHATEVFITGSFNKWSNNADPLEHEDNGYWAGFVCGAKNGNEYKYLLKTPSGDLMRNDPYARAMTNSNGNSLVYNHNAFNWGTAEFNMPIWNKLVIYELHVGTFNVKEPGKPGDMYGVIEKLPYLRDLGINAIEIMPPFEFPGGFSWGYNPAHPFAIESEYG